MNDVFGVGREGGRRGERKCLCCTESQMLKASGSERRGDDTHLFEKTTVVKESTLWGEVWECVCTRELDVLQAFYSQRQNTNQTSLTLKAKTAPDVCVCVCVETKSPL